MMFYGLQNFVIMKNYLNLIMRNWENIVAERSKNVLVVGIE